ncbi:AbrB family transcriptional regulator [Euzebya sp.]|uniref:AbrB family transcriptional regulator n=1 Tax=Euzebya sp. TaxID=1971409 RepID=UPI003518ECB3
MLAALVAGAVTGLSLERLHVPGGLIIGSMVGAAAVTLVRGEGELILPQPLVSAAFIVLGCAIGVTVTRQVVGQFRQIAVGALLSAVAFILFGLAVAVALRWVGLAPDGVVLATSPGALSVMSAAGAEQGVGAQVAVFHTVRVVLVILSLPLLIRVAEV